MLLALVPALLTFAMAPAPAVLQESAPRTQEDSTRIQERRHERRPGLEKRRAAQRGVQGERLRRLRDRYEDRLDRREDARDRREDRLDRHYRGGRRDRLEDRLDRRENRRDRREDVRERGKERSQARQKLEKRLKERSAEPRRRNA